MTKNLIFLLLLFLPLTSCGGGETNRLVPVRLNLIPPSPVSLKSSAVAGIDFSLVAHITLLITGSGMANISLSPEIPPDRLVVINLNIPSGPARVFTITAFDADGNVIFRGETTTDLHPGDLPVQVDIPLVSIIIPPVIPSVSLSVGSLFLNEAFGTTSTLITATFSVSFDQAVTLTLTKSGTATDGVDYTLPNTIVIPAGSSTASVTLAALADKVNDPNETVIISIASVTPSISFNNSAAITVTLLDDKPKPRFAYVANQTDNDISAYVIDPANGTLTATGTPIAAGMSTSTRLITANLTGKFVYTMDLGFIFAYKTDPTTGALTQAGTFTVSTPVSMAVDPAEKFVYAIEGDSGSIATFSIDATNGGLAQASSTSVAPGIQSITIHPTGQFAYVPNFNSVFIFKVNATTGALTSPTQATTTAQNIRSALVDPTGKFAYFMDSNISVGPSAILTFTINSIDGTLSNATSTQVGNQPVAMAVEPNGMFFYLVNAGTVTNTNTNPIGSISSFMIDPKTGAIVTFGKPVPTGVNPSSISIDTSGRFIYVANFGSNDISTYTINKDGSLTPMTLNVPAGKGPISTITTGVIQ